MYGFACCPAESHSLAKLARRSMEGHTDQFATPGLFVAQDGVNGGYAQNFKLVPLPAIEDALAGQ